jgi:hypothetical protein
MSSQPTKKTKTSCPPLPTLEETLKGYVSIEEPSKRETIDGIQGGKNDFCLQKPFNKSSMLHEVYLWFRKNRKYSQKVTEMKADKVDYSQLVELFNFMIEKGFNEFQFKTYEEEGDFENQKMVYAFRKHLMEQGYFFRVIEDPFPGYTHYLFKFNLQK